MKTNKERLDVILVKKGFFQTRQFAQTAIMKGLVFVNNKKNIKPGTFIEPSSQIEVLPDNQTYVSRGGIKLEKALNDFNICVSDRVCLDIGASTGGFTDCLLQKGAKLVYAIDVGYGQIAGKFRTDCRVICIEKTNIRYLTPDILYKNNTPLATLAVIDVSFISILKVLIPILCLLDNKGEIITLVKPQFEAGQKYVKKGIVRSDEIRLDVLNNLSTSIENMGFKIINTIESPIKGRKGNKEFFLHLMPI